MSSSFQKVITSSVPKRRPTGDFGFHRFLTGIRLLLSRLREAVPSPVFRALHAPLLDDETMSERRSSVPSFLTYI